jgi:Haem-binding domain
MSKRPKQAAIVVVVVLIAAQFIRPDRTNPPIDPSRTIAVDESVARDLVIVLDRACSDCHSNATVWPWYTEIQPLSSLMAYAVKEGRKIVNFSEWSTYSTAQRSALLAASCRDTSSGKMPGLYAVLRPEMRLSAGDIETVCAAALEAKTSAATVVR